MPITDAKSPPTSELGGQGQVGRVAADGRGPGGQQSHLRLAPGDVSLHPHVRAPASGGWCSDRSIDSCRSVHRLACLLACLLGLTHMHGSVTPPHRTPTPPPPASRRRTSCSRSRSGASGTTSGAWTRWTAPRSSSSGTGSSPSTSASAKGERARAGVCLFVVFVVFVVFVSGVSMMTDGPSPRVTGVRPVLVWGWGVVGDKLAFDRSPNRPFTTPHHTKAAPRSSAWCTCRRWTRPRPTTASRAR